MKIFPKTSASQAKSDCLQFYIAAIKVKHGSLALNDNKMFGEMELENKVGFGNNDKRVYKFKLLCDRCKVDFNMLTLLC